MGAVHHGPAGLPLGRHRGRTPEYLGRDRGTGLGGRRPCIWESSGVDSVALLPVQGDTRRPGDADVAWVSPLPFALVAIRARWAHHRARDFGVRRGAFTALELFAQSLGLTRAPPSTIRYREHGSAGATASTCTPNIGSTAGAAHDRRPDRRPPRRAERPPATNQGTPRRPVANHPSPAIRWIRSWPSRFSHRPTRGRPASPSTRIGVDASISARPSGWQAVIWPLAFAVSAGDLTAMTASDSQEASGERFAHMRNALRWRPTTFPRSTRR